jgi:hypothetical protein
VYDATPADYRRFVRELRPGDTLRLAPGTYRQGLRLHGLHGAAGASITVEGPAAGEPAVLVGRAGHNTVSLADASYLVIRNLVLRDGGQHVDAVKAEGFRQCASVHHVTLEGLRIEGHGLSQQQVAISSKCPAWDWVIRGNLIRGAGTGMYLGDSDGNAPFVRGLIEGNVVEGTLGYNLQVKHQVAWPEEVPEAGPGQEVTVIRYNLFSKAEGSGPDESARPNVLLGHAPRAGAGIEHAYQVYGNRFFANPHEALLQAEGNVALYGNLFVNPYRIDFPALAIQPHNDVPRRVRIEDNVIFTPGIGIAVRGADPRWPVVVRGNTVSAETPFVGVPPQDNRLMADPGFTATAAPY